MLTENKNFYKANITAGDDLVTPRARASAAMILNTDSGLILGLRPANERRRYKVTPSLIHSQPRISPVTVSDPSW